MSRSQSAAPSPLSPVEAIRQEAEARLRELEPMLEEAARLRGVLAALDGPPPPDAAEDLGVLSSASQPVARARRSAPSGANKQRILEVIADSPGITPREIAVQTGIDRPVVASTVNRLKRRGEVRPEAAPGRRGGVALP
ncbi:MAG TPA: helix-turn-helix domain-containing protein [Solirubrobacteraceae bacterium]|nr:helix-turn-helix domain-containing protein [Solirubrobacteraceae bacterium]